MYGVFTYTFTPQTTQMLLDIPYIERLGYLQQLAPKKPAVQR